MQIESFDSIKNDDVRGYKVQESHKRTLRGLLWGSLGTAMTAVIGTINTLAVLSIGATALSALGMRLGSDFGTFPVLATLTVVALVVDYLTISFTGYCFSNALYHFGPNFTLVKRSKAEMALLFPPNSLKTAG